MQDFELIRCFCRRRHGRAFELSARPKYVCTAGSGCIAATGGAAVDAVDRQGACECANVCVGVCLGVRACPCV